MTNKGRAATRLSRRRMLDPVCSRKARARRATATVEFAVAAPLLALLLLGMVEYGRLVMVQQLLTNAAREGARVAVADNATSSDVESAVKEYLEQHSLGDVEVAVDPPSPGTAAPGDGVVVTVQLPFDNASWLASPLYLAGRTMTSRATMRREGLSGTGSSSDSSGNLQSGDNGESSEEGDDLLGDAGDVADDVGDVADDIADLPVDPPTDTGKDKDKDKKK